MTKKSLFQQFLDSPISIKTMVIAVIGVWGMVLAALVIGAILFMERPWQALQPTPGAAVPVVLLDPTVGPSGTTVNLRGQGWQPGQLVLIYLVAPGQSEPPSYAAAGATADEAGNFQTRVVIPTGPEWANAGLATLIARTSDGAAAQTLFGVVESVQPSVTPSVE